MFVRYFVGLPLPLTAVEAALTRSPEAWVPALARAADAHGQRLLAEVRFRLGGRGRGSQSGSGSSSGSSSVVRHGTWLSLAWRATGPRGLFPGLDSELEIAPLGARQAQVQRPMPAFVRRDSGAWWTGRCHRVAEATVKDFVDRVGGALTRLAAQSGPSV
jgi:hypothetical protein